MKKLLYKYNPAVEKPVLLLLSGLMWLAVGIMLNTLAFIWLKAFGNIYSFVFAIVGISAGICISIFGFSKIVKKNIVRISLMNGKRCVFSFMAWKSYILVIFMITLGITLRHSSLPKQYLSVIYIGIGLALILSGSKYFKVLSPKFQVKS